MADRLPVSALLGTDGRELKELLMDKENKDTAMVVTRGTARKQWPEEEEMRQKEIESGTRPHPVIGTATHQKESEDAVKSRTGSEDEGDDNWMNRIDEGPMGNTTAKPRRTRREKRRQQKELHRTVLLDINEKEFEQLQTTDPTLKPLWEKVQEKEENSITPISFETGCCTRNGFHQEGQEARGQWISWCYQSGVKGLP